jgi:hypothetical protein
MELMLGYKFPLKYKFLLSRQQLVLQGSILRSQHCGLLLDQPRLMFSLPFIPLTIPQQVGQFPQLTRIDPLLFEQRVLLVYDAVQVGI